MKLRLDRVAKVDLGAISKEEALAMGAPKIPDFGPIPKQTTVYSRYAPGWWEVFFPNRCAYDATAIPALLAWAAQSTHPSVITAEHVWPAYSSTCTQHDERDRACLHWGKGQARQLTAA